jgi:integrase
LADYRRTLRRDAIPFFGTIRLVDVEPRTVKRYAAHVAARGVSHSTVRLALAPVRALFATALEDGLIRVNPTLGVRVPKLDRVDEDEKTIRALSEDELRALLAAVDDRHRLLVEFLAQTGLRISEALALQWRDVDLGQGRVHVRRRISKTGGIAPPKSRYGRRDVPLTPRMTRSLWAHRKAAGAREDAPVWVNRLGER